jgi:hypothetical protein
LKIKYYKIYSNGNIVKNMFLSLDNPVDIFKRLSSNNDENNEQYKKILEILQVLQEYSNKNVRTISYDYETYKHNIMEYNIMLNIMNRRNLKLDELAYFATLQAIYDNIKNTSNHNINTLQQITKYKEILVGLKKHKILGVTSSIPDVFVLS